MTVKKYAGWASALAFLALLGGMLGSDMAVAGRISDVTNTKHNLSISGPGSVKAYYNNDPSWNGTAVQSQVCVYCHTPHGATLGVAPLWNRKMSWQTYTRYTSSSMDADVIQGTLNQPGGSSKLCLSCHDGTMAIGNVNVMNGWGNSETTLVGTIMLGTEEWNPTTFFDGTMPYGGAGAISGVSGVYTGYTRRLGTDLSNDHPISTTYTTTLATRDGELRDLDANQKYPATTGEMIGVIAPGYRPKAPLESTGVGGLGQVQCATCHDPHLRETNAALGNQKFLRLNRFQEGAPALSASFDDVNDINCLLCHDKDKNSGAYKYSAHANDNVATQLYTTAAAAMNEFPTTDDGAATNLPIWKASCLNCHDSHTVQGSRRLLREGTDSTSTPKVGGNAATEETCYQCHTTVSASVASGVNPIQDIKSDFTATTPSTWRHMPITLAEQGGIGAEAHDIGGNFNDTGFVDCTGTSNQCGADFIESRAKLGVGNLNNRHAECSDCHNPHRATKLQTLSDISGVQPTGDAKSTHVHTDATGYTHSNIASGALRGTFGVEPTYASDSFMVLPSGYTVKRGDPWTSTSTLVSDSWVTREYQICLKCHSDYGYSDNNQADNDGTAPDRPALPLSGSPHLTPSSTNGMLYYTNQAREFQAPVAHKGDTTATGSGASGVYADGVTQYNYRSWHPVMDDTGRTGTIRGNGTDISSAFHLPWSNAVGSQTMYCSDCHGAAVSSASSVLPDDPDAQRQTWGPHGSPNDFVLKGTWSDATGPAATLSSGLCFKCHNFQSYGLGTAAASAVGASRTGFWMTDVNLDGHQRHVDLIGGGGSRCTMCHTAVPHGFKNKALLVNLNDVSTEADATLTNASEVRIGTTAGYSTNADTYVGAPYYLNAMLKIINFKPSGQWTAADCGSATGIGTGTGVPQSGVPWMKTSSENCLTPP